MAATDEKSETKQVDMSRLANEGKQISLLPDETTEAEPEERIPPQFQIRELDSPRIIRSIPVQRGLTWRDVNAIAAGMLTGAVLQAGQWLDMSNAYWPQDSVR